jgi:protein TonB
VILEAGKPRRKPPADSAPPSEAADARRIAAAPPAGPAAGGSPASSRKDAAAGASTLVEVARARVAPAEATLNADARLSTPALVDATALDRAVAVPAPALPEAVALPALARIAAPAAPPKLLRRVDPEVPLRLRDEIARGLEVRVDLTIEPDGSVSGANVLPPAPRSLHRYIVEALEQWRYEPQPTALVHRVQLVFDPQ